MTHHRRQPVSRPDLTSAVGPDQHLLRLLSTTDLHMNLDGYDYCADQRGLPFGITRIGTLIKSARAEAEAAGATTLLMDNGDGLQGTPLADVMADQIEGQHPLALAFDHLDYDLIGLGNHDFNFGLKVLERIFAPMACPVVASNLRWTGRDAPPYWHDHKIVTKTVPLASGPRDLKIGIAAFVPPEVMIWDAHVLRGMIEVQDILPSARHWAKQLRKKGCDVVVLMPHAGLGAQVNHPDETDVILELAGIDGVDAIIAGHTHRRLPGKDHDDLDYVDQDLGTVAGVPAVMAGHSGAYLGQIDLVLDGAGEDWQTVAFQSQLLPVAHHRDHPVAADPETQRLVAPAHNLARQALSAPVGQIDSHIHSYFGRFSVDWAMQLIARANATALSGLLAGSEWADLPVLAATAPQGSSFETGGRGYSDIPSGPVSLRHVADICVFPDALNAVVMTGRDLRDWMEQSAGIFHKITPGKEGQRVLRDDIPPYEFDVLFGLNYQIDPSQPRRFAPSGRLVKAGAARISDLSCGGQPIDPDARFVVALSSYRANGRSTIAGLRKADLLPLPRLLIRDAVTAYLRTPTDSRHPPLPTQSYPWHFAPLAETSVRVETDIGALPHLGDIPDMQIRQMRVDHPAKRLSLVLDMPQAPLQPVAPARI